MENKGCDNIFPSLSSDIFVGNNYPCWSLQKVRTFIFRYSWRMFSMMIDVTKVSIFAFYHRWGAVVQNDRIYFVLCVLPGLLFSFHGVKPIHVLGICSYQPVGESIWHVLTPGGINSKTLIPCKNGMARSNIKWKCAEDTKTVIGNQFLKKNWHWLMFICIMRLPGCHD